MNIIREMRRIKNISVIPRMGIILILIVVLIVSTYAWFDTSKSVKISMLKGLVSSWNILYKYDDTNLDEEITLTFDDFHPGFSETREINVINLGIVASNIEVDLVRIDFLNENLYAATVDGYGELVRDPVTGQCFATGYLAEPANHALSFKNNRKYMEAFNNDKYPFKLTCTLNKSMIAGAYNEATQQPSSAKADIFVSLDWEYNARVDEKDTQIGKDAYLYYEGLKNRNEEESEETSNPEEPITPEESTNPEEPALEQEAVNEIPNSDGMVKRGETRGPFAITLRVTASNSGSSTIQTSIPEGLTVGEEVDYTMNGSYTWYNGLAGTDSDMRVTQVISDNSTDQEPGCWRVLKIDDSSGKIDLIPKSYIKTITVKFEGYNGYNNAVKLLNDVCNSIYKNEEKGIVARSINIEDIENLMNMSSSMISNAKNVYGYGIKNSFSIPNIFFPKIYEKETLEVNAENPLDKPWKRSRQDGWLYGYMIQNTSREITSNYYKLTASEFSNVLGSTNSDILLNSSIGNNFWVSSRYVDIRGEYASFGLMAVKNGELDCVKLYDIGDNKMSAEMSIMPVVTVDAELITLNNSTFRWQVNI